MTGLIEDGKTLSQAWGRLHAAPRTSVGEMLHGLFQHDLAHIRDTERDLATLEER